MGNPSPVSTAVLLEGHFSYAFNKEKPILKDLRMLGIQRPPRIFT